jgi:hypothetical protein
MNKLKVIGQMEVEVTFSVDGLICHRKIYSDSKQTKGNFTNLYCCQTEITVPPT